MRTLRIVFLLSLAALPIWANLTGVTVSPSVTTTQTTTYTVVTGDDGGAGDIFYTNVIFGPSAIYVGTCVVQITANPGGSPGGTPFAAVWDDSLAAWRTIYQNSYPATAPHCTVWLLSVTNSGNTSTAVFTVTYNSTFPTSGAVWGQAYTDHFASWGFYSIGSIYMAGPTVAIVNQTRPNNANFFLTGDTMQVSVTAAPNQTVMISAVINGVQQRGYSPGSTDGTGRLVWYPPNAEVPHWGAYSWTFSVGGIPCTPSPVQFYMAPSPVVVLSNLTRGPGVTDFAVGDTLQLEVSHAEVAALLTGTGTQNGTFFGPTTYGSTNTGTDASGNPTGYVYAQRVLTTADMGNWNETFFLTSGTGVQYALGTFVFTVYPSSSVSIANSVMGTQDTTIDDQTGDTVPLPDPNHPAAAMITVHLPSGRKASVRSAAGGMPLATFDSSWKSVGEQTEYTYKVDTRGVWVWKISDDFSYALQDPTSGTPEAVRPDGWNWYGAGFGAGKRATYEPSAIFSFRSRWYPGLVPMFFQSPAAAGGLPMNEKTADNAAMVAAAGIERNSLIRFAIGPAFWPGMTRDQLTSLVAHWVNDLGYGLFQPFLDGKPLESIDTGNSDLDRQFIQTLQAALDRATK